jgi:hypothetical protein
MWNLDLFDANVQKLVGMAQGKRIRIASKSVLGQPSHPPVATFAAPTAPPWPSPRTTTLLKN